VAFIRNAPTSVATLLKSCVNRPDFGGTIEATKEMPRYEFDLRRQIRRAVVSIPANIAEGYRRKKKRPVYRNHVSIALGSQGELETEIEIARRNSLMTTATCRRVLEICDRVGAMLYRLHESLE
jgi:carbamoyl-phosphate synthase large subunit